MLYIDYVDLNDTVDAISCHFTLIALHSIHNNELKLVAYLCSYQSSTSVNTKVMLFNLLIYVSLI